MKPIATVESRFQTPIESLSSMTWPVCHPFVVFGQPAGEGDPSAITRMQPPRLIAKRFRLYVEKRWFKGITGSTPFYLRGQYRAE